MTIPDLGYFVADMTDKEYFSHLYEIASHLNKEFSLPAALRQAIEKTVELLDLETGWIWLSEKDLKSVYLAASYNLPPALSDHPERLSGWCYCIDKYLTGNIEEATNISEITCTRLKDIASGTRDLKFHATIPIITNGQKIGLINLLSKEKQMLDDKQLSILNTIAELIGIAIQRTRLQDTYHQPNHSNDLKELIQRIFQTRIDDLLDTLNKTMETSSENNLAGMQSAIRQAEALKKQLSLILNEATERSTQKNEQKEFTYPASPLTQRELEVLSLVRKGLTNGQIAEQLYIAERTVKFHITSILSKLYAKTRTQAVDIALQRGLLSA
ncbi:MAG: LuxR C-terminal-related transcriptional regulator [Bacteroidota bacterium]